MIDLKGNTEPLALQAILEGLMKKRQEYVNWKTGEWTEKLVATLLAETEGDIKIVEGVIQQVVTKQ